ncbi:hypothetical protein PPSIR1_11285 [Plesiocystis pacifica SIR-1]|uniref:Glycosyltransferase RgtA/B/C/D-like domain-containing protein n=2 Tax=Plesiocystis pacifica TaxID=191768 RepID=A6G160_9BACT|nr:hypothetical protein PPSIR1_11285 [Plesiocystis pacifica SIR-1]
MHAMDARKQAMGTAATLVALALLMLASLWLRWPAFVQGGFVSHDVAGMLYNAMVLDAGGLPYVDTLELKAPGSFWLARAFAGPEGRDIARFQVFANLWALGSLAAVAAVAWRSWGRLASVVAAGLYGLHDAFLDSMDANYVTWANLPQILAFGLGIEAWRSQSPRWRPTLWLAAGAAAGCAALCKRPDGVVLVVLLAMGARAQAQASSEARRASWREPAWVLAGFCLAHLPLAALYLGRGELGALLDGYVVNRWGLRYVNAKLAGSASAPGSGSGVGEGLLASAHFLGLPLALAAFAGAAALPKHTAASEAERRELAWVLAWLGATLFAASLGLRFYKGYFLACAAPACLAAAAPWGLWGRRCRAHWVPRVVASALALGLVLRCGLLLDAERRSRARAHDTGGRRIAAHLIEHGEPGDRVWVWGWHLWDVYPLTGQLSASRVYKSLGILSQPNDDTWRRPSTPLRFVETEHAQTLLDDLERTRPRFIVLGSTVPRREFGALQTFLRAHYRLDRSAPRIGRVQFWRRLDDSWVDAEHGIADMPRISR